MDFLCSNPQCLSSPPLELHIQCPLPRSCTGFLFAAWKANPSLFVLNPVPTNFFI